MKTAIIPIAGVALALFLSAAGPSEAAAVSQARLDLFYDALAPEGVWFETTDYGYVFQPTAATTDPGWRPYTRGSWAHSGDGWLWISNEPFGWACYHYGRWAWLDDVGWVWVPGDVWAPSWVAFRTGPDYVGWAPLPPITRGWREISYTVDADCDIGPDLYVFVPAVYFIEDDDCYRHIIHHERNAFIFGATLNTTRIYFRGDRICNSGPDYDHIVRVAGRPRHVNVRYEDWDGRRRDSYAPRWSGNDYTVFAPDVELRAGAKPAKIARRLDRFQRRDNWSRIEDPDQRQRLQERLTAESALSRKERAQFLRELGAGKKTQATEAADPRRSEEITKKIARRLNVAETPLQTSPSAASKPGKIRPAQPVLDEPQNGVSRAKKSVRPEDANVGAAPGGRIEERGRGAAGKKVEKQASPPAVRIEERPEPGLPEATERKKPEKPPEKPQHIDRGAPKRQQMREAVPPPELNDGGGQGARSKVDSNQQERKPKKIRQQPPQQGQPPRVERSEQSSQRKIREPERKQRNAPPAPQMSAEKPKQRHAGSSDKAQRDRADSPPNDEGAKKGKKKK